MNPMNCLRGYSNRRCDSGFRPRLESNTTFADEPSDQFLTKSPVLSLTGNPRSLCTFMSILFGVNEGSGSSRRRSNKSSESD
jgi:hypothetical protein